MQVIPRLDSPSFFEETCKGKWPEVALFAFTFQPVCAMNPQCRVGQHYF